jgi:hypothetical protein
LCASPDARVDQPWRGWFRHPDLIGWVRANRSRLVAGCLTLCRAWIAAGRPRGQRSIGSYESWAQTLGGVLEVAGIEGFLGNLDEMIEASDSEGAVWRRFVSAWWNRFGTAEVGTGDLYEVALVCEPPLPLGRAAPSRTRPAGARMRTGCSTSSRCGFVLGVSPSQRWQSHEGNVGLVFRAFRAGRGTFRRGGNVE